jgi:hypothetical protein
LYYYQLNETWELDGSTWRLGNRGSGPAVVGSAMTYSEVDGRVLSFGGAACIEKGTPTFPTCPKTCPAETRITAPNELDQGVYCGETMGYRDGAWGVLTTSGPAARTGAAMAYHPGRRKVLLYGGKVNGGEASEDEIPGEGYTDTWAWNGHSWRRLAEESEPPNCCWFQMAYHEGKGKMFLYGSRGGLWEMVEGD